MNNLPVGTQFSIYKIETETLDNLDIKEVPGTTEYVEEVILALLDSVCLSIKKKPFSQIQLINYQQFSGVVFKTVHEPAWKKVIEQIISQNELEQQGTESDFLTNTNVSYIFFYPAGLKIYACTGGYGSNYISKFTVKNYGLSLLPKLIDRNNPVIKSVNQNNLVGNQASTNKVNRRTTTVSSEQDMSSIIRNLTVEVERSLAEDIGVPFDDNESEQKRTNLVSKDSFIIRRSFTLDELKVLLDRLSEIEEKEDAFALNYIVLAKKKGLKNSDLYEKMVLDFSEDDYFRFTLVGDEYEQYYLNASRYILKDENNIILIDQNEPIELQDVLVRICSGDKKASKAGIRKMLKQWRLTTEDNGGNTVLFPRSIFDSLQGFVEYGELKSPCYLFNGNWFVFDKQYDALLTGEFKELFKNNLPESSKINLQWGLSHSSSSEEEYNQWLAQKSYIQVAHKVQMGNIEIADAILFDKNDDNVLYLMHNKDSFSGIGARDLTNQILSSSEYLNMHLITSDAESFLGEYYDKIASKAMAEKRQINIEKTEFVKRFRNAKICYIAGYLKQFSSGSNSTYAKYLSIELKRKLETRNFKLVIMGLD